MLARAARAAAVLGAALALLAPAEAQAKPRAHPRRAAPAKRAAQAAVPAPAAPPKVDEDAKPEAETKNPMPAEHPPAETETTPATPVVEPPVADSAPADAPFERKLDLGGRLFTYIRAPLTDYDKPLQQLSSSLWLDGRARMTKATFASVSLVGDLMSPSIEGKVEARARIREAYAAADSGGVELRVGQQILSWGNADGLHAVDLLTAHDYSFFSVSGDARQIGAPSMMLSYSPNEGASAFRVTAVWQPVFPSSKVFIPAGRLPPKVRVADEERAPLSIANSEAAVKIGYSPGGWDVAVIGFHGFNHLSEPYLKSRDEATGEAVIGRTHHRYEAVGLQASVALDAWVLRFEGAYVMTENHDGSNRLVQPTHVDAIAGVERPIGERVRVSLQGVCRYHPFFLPLEAPFKGTPTLAEANKQIASVNAAVLDYTHQVRPGASLAVAYTSEDEALELGVAGLAHFIGFDFVVQPTIGYRLFGALKLDLGVQFFGGNKTTSLGFFSAQSGAFAQATYTF